jgi:hypothetical protein
VEPGSPNPAVLVSKGNLLVAYVCRNPDFPGWETGESANHPGFDVYSAVLSFELCAEHRLGPPSDEKLHMHPLYASGLTHYRFFEVVAPGADSIWRNWIITFHDQVLEVKARSARVFKHRVAGEDTVAILASMVQCSDGDEAI